jgi:hypothetical protein
MHVYVMNLLHTWKTCMFRVTRLAEFSPGGRFIYMGIYLKNYNSRPKFWANFSLGIVMHKFCRTMGSATFWATFSHTHLATLGMLYALMYIGYSKSSRP